MTLILIFLPILAAALVGLLDDPRAEAAKRGALMIALVTLLASLGAYLAYPLVSGGFVGEFKLEWLPLVGSSFHVGLDGLSLPFVTLTPLLTAVSVLASWRKTEKGFFALMLLLQGALVGVFAALDLIVFFLFFEAVLVPMYFMIALWGYEQRRYAAVKFLIYSLVGSVFMLAAMLATAYLAAPALGRVSFDYLDLVSVAGYLALLPAAGWLFWGFALAFLIKLPAVPLHTWLPHAHTQAPTAGSIFLAGLLLKMGGYGLIRFNLALFPGELERFAGVLAVVALVSIVYGAYVTLAQRDLKRLIANSSVNHMGYVLLGIASMTAVGLHGAVYQMVAHGVITGLMFLMVGLLADRTHTREIAAMKGVYNAAPKLGAVLWLALLGGLGLPGLAGFLGEFQSLWGGFLAEVTRNYVWFAVFGIVILAGAMLWTIQRVLLGKAEAALDDLNAVELAAAAPLVFLAVLLGLVPAALTPWIDAGVQPLVTLLQEVLK